MLIKKLSNIMSIFVVVFLSFFSCLLIAEEANPLSSTKLSYSNSFLQMMLGLMFVIAMIFGVIWLMKKVGYKGYTSSGHISVKSTLALSAKEKVLLLEVGEEQILVGVSANGINHIKTLDNPINTSSDNNGSSSLFSDKLKLMLSKSHQWND